MTDNLKSNPTRKAYVCKDLWCVIFNETGYSIGMEVVSELKGDVLKTESMYMNKEFNEIYFGSKDPFEFCEDRVR